MTFMATPDFVISASAGAALTSGGGGIGGAAGTAAAGGCRARSSLRVASAGAVLSTDRHRANSMNSAMGACRLPLGRANRIALLDSGVHSEELDLGDLEAERRAVVRRESKT